MHHVGRGLLAGAIALAGCKTAMRPVTCEQRPYACTGERDVKFCESEVVAAEGAGCAALGLAASGRFCFVTPAETSCVRTTYEVTGRDCRVVEYRGIREWRECSPGTPTFAP